MKDVYRADGSRNKEATWGKKRVDYCKFTFLQGMPEVYQADYLTNADQMILD